MGVPWASMTRMVLGPSKGVVSQVSLFEYWGKKCRVLPLIYSTYLFTHDGTKMEISNSATLGETIIDYNHLILSLSLYIYIYVLQSFLIIIQTSFGANHLFLVAAYEGVSNAQLCQVDLHAVRRQDMVQFELQNDAYFFNADLWLTLFLSWAIPSWCVSHREWMGIGVGLSWMLWIIPSYSLPTFSTRRYYGSCTKRMVGQPLKEWNKPSFSTGAGVLPSTVGWAGNLKWANFQRESCFPRTCVSCGLRFLGLQCWLWGA